MKNKKYIAALQRDYTIFVDEYVSASQLYMLKGSKNTLLVVEPFEASNKDEAEKIAKFELLY